MSAVDAIIRDSYPDRAEWLLIYCEEDIEDISRWLNEYRKQRSKYERYLAEVGHKEYELAVEELDMEIEFLEMCLKFCAAEDHAVQAMQRARKNEERLQKFLQVKREHF